MSTTTSLNADIERWRTRRLERLTAPDGWLTLVGLPWLDPGDNTIGSAIDNAIVVEGLPAHFGNVHLDTEGEASITLTGEGLIDGEPKSGAILQDDEHPHPTLVSAGDISFFLIRRGDHIGLRIKNTHAAAREHFQGLDYFPPDPSWRIDAEWRPARAGEVLEMGTAIGTIERHPVAGHAVFERDGHRCELLPVIESPEDEQYFLVFADQTSGKETYGAARFLYTEEPKDGRIVLDFNKAYNPPCVFTAFATCPMAPPENRLPLRVTAGELKYAGGHPE
ncbi:MAG TPA: DUF1684 domain-containing protein [Rhodanobacteraceae bacterium]|nr:DUF1684 domain-containing protein [Rhodanobacteraceae bacterium]